MPHVQRGRHAHACLLALALLAPPSVAADPALPAPRAALTPDTLGTLVAHLATAHPVERLRFAAIALDELAAAYGAELDAAAADRRRNDDAANLARWRAGARASIARLHATAAELAHAPDVRLFIDPGDTLRFVLTGRTVLIDAPRVSGPDALNARIARRYCERAACPENIMSAADLAAPRVWTSWSFGANVPALLETSSGLDFRFADLQDMGARKRHGRELVSALERSARLLAWHRERGLVVDWPLLHLAPAPDGDGSALVVNAAGDWLPVPLAWRALPREPLARWYQARVAGRRYRHVFGDGERLLRPAPSGAGDAG
ncbi:MAG: hypothetical protein RLW62_06755 [Gammaproteobacteria bacterium]